MQDKGFRAAVNMNIRLCYKEKQFLFATRMVLALITLAILLVSVSSPVHAASRIVWSDTFSGVNLDASKWNVVNAPSWNKGEWEVYTDKNVSIHNNSLLIRSDDANNKYTSGEVNTFQKYSFTYGRVDIQAKLPYGQGIWPSFWLLTANCQMYPSTGSGCDVTPKQSYGEVDIMEMLGQNPHYIYLTNHFGYYPNQNLSHQCTYTGPDYSADYHVFSIDWQPGSLTWLIDGVPHCHQTDGVPNGPMFLVLNTAIGGLFPGNPNITTQFPQYTQIGYVHISQ